MDNKHKECNRRSFIKGTAAASAIAASMGLWGCAPQQSPVDGSQSNSSNTVTANEFDITEELTTQIVIVGAGNSGLTAAVQAAELGAGVILLEVNATHGTNTEGLFAVDSHYQQAQEIQVTMEEVTSKEQVFFNYRVNALFWKDLIANSSENLDWLEGYGVRFSGQVDNYHHLGHLPVFHWFVDGKGSNLTEPLFKSAEELGVRVCFESRGRKLIIENGSVAGIYAENLDGSYTKISCDAVILATGGFTGDVERMEKLGIPEVDIAKLTIGRVGDGINMAVEAGAEDRSEKSCFLREASFSGKGWLAPGPDFAIYSGIPIWINENGERFANELCSKEASGCVTNAHYTQKDKFALWGQAAYSNMDEEVRASIDELLADEELSMYAFNDLASLCDQFDINSETLQQEINTYNLYCEQGKDKDFGKDSTVLVQIDAPYYIGHFTAMNMQSIGGITTNRKAEVLGSDGETIQGLYAVGTDGCMLYGETYTISVPASCNGNNINSGRTAARNAVAYLS